VRNWLGGFSKIAGQLIDPFPVKVKSPSVFTVGSIFSLEIMDGWVDERVKFGLI